MGPCDDLPAKPELLHWGTMRRVRRDLVTRLCRASVNSAIKEHGVMCRLTATAFDENDPSVRTLRRCGVTAGLRFMLILVAYLHSAMQSLPYM
ncbi:hypothetical protein AVEN_82848-1 [Araneus ventricosus]|uniref:Uncharacterized protein n=1 Tax=Araneus ventricosus TaxID=182803 RepID=A0A4Y2F6P0_ARAVE|nr:hypothetical protein AVEN_82848-1 [Araneus ventricosus]